MAVIAGIRGTQLHRDIRPGNSKAVIVPLVDHHVGADGHMARRAGHRRRHAFVAGV